MRIAAAAVMALATLAPATCSHAQDSPADQPRQSPCQTAPEEGTGANGGSADGGQELSSQLDRCNGVLQPPPTKDPGMVEQPPAEGTTPVIPPGTVPEQQPSD